MRIDAFQAKLLCQLRQREQLRFGIGSMLKTAAGGDDIVKQRRGKEATLSELLNANVALALAQLGAVGIDQQWQMTELRRLPAKSSEGREEMTLRKQLVLLQRTCRAADAL